MNETQTSPNYPLTQTGTHSVEKEHFSSIQYDKDAYDNIDSQIASQILTSFRSSVFQKRNGAKKDLMDQATYHDLDTRPHKMVNSGLDHTSTLYSETINAIESPGKLFRDYSNTQLSPTQEIQIHSLDFPRQNTSANYIKEEKMDDGYDGQIQANLSEGHQYLRPIYANDYDGDTYGSHDTISDIQFSLDTSGLVSSTNDNGDIMLNGEVPSSSFSIAHKPNDKTYQKKDHELPPCRVCGYKASGFHYGANTCEACKGFFRRSLKKESLEYKCILGEYKCVIQKGRRNNCPLCRYNRCLDVGMSKDAIKTGRYTHEKRTQDIIEVKGLKGATHSPDFSVSSLKPFGIKIKEERVLGEEHLGLIDRIYSAHKICFPLWHKALESGMLPSLCKAHLEKYLMKTNSQNQTLNQPQEKLEDTDDEERNRIMDVLTTHLELAIKTFVKFAKSIPGFCNLPLNDQAALIKSSRFEVWIIGAHKFMNVEHNVVVGPRGKSFHADELSAVLEEGFVKKMFEFSAVLQEIALTNQETAMMKCVVLTFADRCDLEAPDKVEEVQLNLVSCLQGQLNSCRRFSQVMNALVTLRDLTEWNKRISENLVLEWPTIKHNPLLMEVMNI